ncbi:BnaC06g25150D [Brassica napus]|uniref:BnaC06g25150D protein n=1 Tax=Brassica napus TaxID=3708 RepID=A0A078GDY1_BRANA|nr:BnaC06g25150D [Brassica napus]
MRQNKLPLRRSRAREPEPRPPPPVVRDEIRFTAIEDGGDEREPILGDEVEEEMNETKEEERNEVNEEEDNEDVESELKNKLVKLYHHFEDVAGNDGGDDV